MRPAEVVVGDNFDTNSTLLCLVSWTTTRAEEFEAPTPAGFRRFFSTAGGRRSLADGDVSAAAFSGAVGWEGHTGILVGAASVVNGRIVALTNQLTAKRLQFVCCLCLGFHHSLPARYLVLQLQLGPLVGQERYFLECMDEETPQGNLFLLRVVWMGH